MPVQTSPPLLPDSFPSLMSVFGEESPTPIANKAPPADVNPLRLPIHVTVNNPFRRPLPFQHRESISSMTSGSTDSSPTTTVSTFDSPIAPDPSPSSSPESPSSMPLSYSTFMPIAPNNLSPMASALPMPQRATSPGRRARNLKNLSLRMPPPFNSSRRMETNPQPHLSAPASPVHMPVKGMRRKPAGLTIRTPGLDRPFSPNIPDLAPQTPHGRLSLRHTESSPSLTSVFSPSFGPKGGMQLPQHGYRRASATAEDNTLSPVQSVGDEAAAPALHKLAEEDDHLDSRESTRRSERGYPNGPIRIYDSGVFLYLEPTKAEAALFDVVVNVAKEVANPFDPSCDASQTVMSTWRNGTSPARPLSCSTPFTAFSDASFKSALEYPPSATSSSPATPRNEPAAPEYVHVGWDHNSEILDDLPPLCELIDTRISQGKRVLVHCQLGASRSASLVIAYGLYKNRHLDFNSMYEMVKARSQWVSPNMSLIYQLTDFRSRLLRESSSRPSSQEWYAQGPRRSSEPQTPVSGRLNAQENLGPFGSSGSDPEPTSSNGLSQASMHSSSLSVPWTNRTTTPIAATCSGVVSNSLSHKRSLSPRPLALRQSFFSPEAGKCFVRPDIITSASLAEGGPCLSKRDVFMKEDPDESLALFSPRTTGFLASKRPRPMSGILEDIPPADLACQPPIADPRSPPQGHERLIMRNIDEFL
ncbi:hypothetical protein ARAM_007483 [Aspergillus rambellii]|uniref:protein-tyrosine-phosphatase n=1 Tax=Aspergillus rambellii TaxID=308745 RepID=A0A0F8V5C5_9EURO|nr:hypothetical protein ARAM_007483 [Aspergillus rambellii]